MSASQRGPLTISALSNVGHSPTTVVSNTCHVGNGLFLCFSGTRFIFLGRNEVVDE